MPRFALLLALAGYWLPWLSHPAAALRLNGYELSEWITFLPGVRDGTLSLTRLQFLLPLAGLALLCALVAVRPASRPVLTPVGAPLRPPSPAPRTGLAALLPNVASPAGWAFLLAGAICAFVVLPPYPYLLTAHADPEYRAQLLAAILTFAAFLIVVYLPHDLNAAAQLVVALAALVSAVPPMLSVRPAAEGVLNAAWPLGLGWPALLAGLAWLGWLGLARLFSPRQ